MPIVYTDKAVKNGEKDRHPSLEVNENHPCYKMVREAIDNKSVFHWTREQAYAMFEWYCGGWKFADLVDEFGERVGDYTFKDILRGSYYLVEDPKSVGKKEVLIPSPETIEELHAAVTMEKKMLEQIAEDEANKKAEEGT